MDKIIIRLYGQKISVRNIETERLPSDTFKTVSDIGILLDPYFYHNLKSEKISCIDDISYEVLSGMTCTQSSHIELFINGQKRLKFTFSDILGNGLTLIPLFKHFHKFNLSLESKLLYIRFEFGYIGKYSFKIEKFDLYKVSFATTSFGKTLVLDGVAYESQILKLEEGDCLITSQYIDSI